jgi:Na+/H+ antiporter NhaD/arsenite permease-like protein
VAALGLVIDFVLIALLYRPLLSADSHPIEEYEDPVRTRTDSGRHRRHRAHSGLLIKSLVVTLTTVGLFFTGLPIALVALGAAAVLLLGRVRPEKIYRQVDWSLLVMFSGLFIVVHAFEIHVVERWGIDQWDALLQHPISVLSFVSAGLSNLVSNVPAVLLFKPIIPLMPAGTQETAWLALALSSTFAGNLTILGSVANLIVVENARREGIDVSLWQYCRVGMPLTVLTLVLGVCWLRYVPY